jgi:two-component system chemotaxis response regulator CheB
MATRDVIVVGASAGGVEPLRCMAAGLPQDLSASVFVVLHVAPDRPSTLARLLDRAVPLRATSAE